MSTCPHLPTPSAWRRTLRQLMAAGALLMALGLTRCEQPGDVGYGLLQGPLPGVIDSLELTLSQRRVDSLPTVGQTHLLLGRMNDPLTGLQLATAYVPFSFSRAFDRTALPAGAVLRVEDVVLDMAIQGPVGRTDEAQNLLAYEVTDPWDQDRLWTSRDELAVDATLNLAEGETLSVPVPPDEGTVQAVNIPLNHALGEKLLAADASVYASSQRFQQYFRGLRLSTDPLKANQTGAIFRLRIDASLLQIRLMYAWDEAVDTNLGGVDTTLILSAQDTLIYPVDVTNQHWFHALDRRQVDGTPLAETEAQAQMGDSLNLPRLFIQSGNLIQLEADLPDLAALQGQAINRAELILPADETYVADTTSFRKPSSLAFLLADSTGQAPRAGLPNFALGVWEPDCLYYSARLTNYIQQVLLGNDSLPRILVWPSNVYSSNRRVVLNGPGHPTRPPRLRLFYTPIN